MPIQYDLIAEYLKSGQKSSALSKSFKAPQNVIKDAEALDKEQTRKHRDTLLKSVNKLAWASFILLATVNLLQMIIRIWNNRYNGISDIALNILAVSVFGEVISVVGTIVYHLWKVPKNH